MNIVKKYLFFIPQDFRKRFNLVDRPIYLKSSLHPLIKIDTHKLIYFPIPKVACTSFKYVFAKLLKLDQSYNINDLNTLHLIDFPSLDRHELTGDIYKNYLKFACIRNPLDRLVSCYKNTIKHSDNYNDIHFQNGIPKRFKKYKVFKAGMSFREFVKVIYEIPDSESDCHFRSQWDFITDIKGELLVDFLARYECLAEDYLKLSKLSKVELPSLPHMNNTSLRSKPYFEYYKKDQDLLRIALKRYEKDMFFLNYKSRY